MNTRILSARIKRPMMLVAALAAIAMALALTMSAIIRPVAAASGPTAHLQESQKGTDSSEAQDDCTGQNVPAGEVLWHFILNGLDPGITVAISGHFEFDGASTLNVDSSKWNPDGTTHHFYVFTTGDDILLDATADIGGSSYNNLVLSHICHGGETGQSTSESASEAESASAEQSVEASASGESSFKAGEGTPGESTPDGSLFGNGANPLPTIAFSLILLASLGGLAYANVKTVRNRI